MARAKVLPSSWEELLPDLLGLVLRRLPSLADRVRLRAVCRPWRAGAAAQRHPLLPPPLPWLALRDGSMVDLNGAPVHCAPILREGVDFGYLAVDLAFLVHNNGGCSLMNPLSGLRLPLPKLAPAVLQALDKSRYYNQSFIHKTHAKAVIVAAPFLIRFPRSRLDHGGSERAFGVVAKAPDVPPQVLSSIPGGSEFQAEE